MPALTTTRGIEASSRPSHALDRLVQAEPKPELRTKINEFIGTAFYGQLLKALQNNPLKGRIGHGGRGEEIFAGQLYGELAQRAGRASRFPLGDALYERLVRTQRGDGVRPVEPRPAAQG